MATDTLHTNSSAWPQVGNPPPNAMSPTDPNPEWEMVADDTTTNTGNSGGDGKTITDSDNNNNNNNDHVVILPADIGSSIKSNKSKIKGRPRSATIGGGQASSSTPIYNNNKTSSTTQHADRTTNPSDSNHGDTSISSDFSSRTKRRILRRCVSTPDLLVSDNAHEVIVEDESDDDETSSSCEEPEDVELDESFEVVSDNEEEDEEADQDDDDSGEGTDEPLFMIDDEDTDIRCDEESATLVSTPSMDTSTAWTMASAVPSTATGNGSVWGMKKSPSFAEMLAKNIDSDGNSKNGGASVGWGADKTKTEAMLRNSHRKHHLRVKTKPKFIVTEDVDGKTMKHAHSTGDLSQMLVGAEQERARMFGQGRKRMTKKQFSDIMEEDEEGDFVIGRGDGGGGGGGGGGDGDVLGDTDAMDFYHRKDKGSKGASNKKKLRPDEAKRKDIIMHKKDLQRKKQAESQKGGGGSNEKDTPGKKKKKNEKGVGGKKERRRL
mmetsp:Transcript_26103/g.44394  ORF Transcript_26103/g.44394 Transcript_26103/m.44394 type:complete len:492 (-) Transcript_26103:334-1809(-)